MAIAIQQISPVAHLPLVLGVVRKLNVAALIDTFCPPHPAHVLSCGRGVEALLLAILDGHHALYKVGARLEERGMVALLQPGLTRASLHDYRLGQILDALFAAHLNRVFGAIALNALEAARLTNLDPFIIHAASGDSKAKRDWQSRWYWRFEAIAGSGSQALDKCTPVMRSYPLMRANFTQFQPIFK